MKRIYKITNEINNYLYIGQTSRDLHIRFNEHVKDSKREKFKNRPMYKDMNKYGHNKFNIFLIEYCEDGEADERECYWIKYYDTFNNGYNSTFGGAGKRYINNEEVLNNYYKTRSVKKTAKLCKYSRDTVSRILVENGFTSEELKNNGHKGNYKPVLMLDINTNEKIKTFSNISEVCPFLNIKNPTHISDVCKGKRKSAYGYKWEYL